MSVHSILCILQSQYQVFWECLNYQIKGIKLNLDTLLNGFECEKYEKTQEKSKLITNECLNKIKVSICKDRCKIFIIMMIERFIWKWKRHRGFNRIQ